MSMSFKLEFFLFTMSIALTYMFLYSLLNVKIKVCRSKMCFYFQCCRNLRSNAMKYRVSTEEQLGIHHRIAIFRCALQSLKLLSVFGIQFLFIFGNESYGMFTNGSFMLTF